MYVRYLRVQNYRSLEDVELIFSKNANYLVGENAIGKSSVLRLLSLLSLGTGITEYDYHNSENPVIVTAELELLDNPEEHYVDRPEEHRLTLKVRLEKKIDEVYPRLYNAEDNTQLPLGMIRRVRYIFHSAVKNNRSQLIASHVQKLLEEKFKQLMGEQTLTLSDAEKEYSLRQDFLGDFDVSYYINIFYLSHLLGQEGRSQADNAKFISSVALNVLAQIFAMYQSREIPFNHTVICDKEGRRYLPLLVAIDEPEIHVQPYMQRSILYYYRQILHNEDPAFCGLLKALFGLDGLRGQLFVVTHSTDALVDDYRNIIRFYRDSNNKVKAACGATFHFSEEIEKHLIMHFPEVKESLYARSVIIVEGETEYGCFQLFGNTLSLRFDYYGICLINARGESSIIKIKRLLEYFKIPVVALYDADVQEFRQGEKNVFFTEGICFEMDLAKALLLRGKRQALDNIITTLDGSGSRVNGDMLKKACNKLGLARQSYGPVTLKRLTTDNVETLLVYYFAWLYSNKGVILGRMLGQSLEAEDIPPAFVKVIRKAGELARV